MSNVEAPEQTPPCDPLETDRRAKKLFYFVVEATNNENLRKAFEEAVKKNPEKTTFQIIEEVFKNFEEVKKFWEDGE
jgi:hypothetical protein